MSVQPDARKQEDAARLRGEGLSLRAIGVRLGVDQKQVQRWLAKTTVRPPRVVGLDGRIYPASRVSAPDGSGKQGADTAKTMANVLRRATRAAVKAMRMDRVSAVWAVNHPTACDVYDLKKPVREYYTALARVPQEVFDREFGRIRAKLLRIRLAAKRPSKRKRKREV